MNQDELSEFQSEVLIEIEEKGSEVDRLVAEQRERQNVIDRLRQELRGLWDVHRGIDSCIEKESGHPIGITAAILEVLSIASASSPSILKSLQEGQRFRMDILNLTLADINATLKRLVSNKEVESYTNGGVIEYGCKPQA